MKKMITKNAIANIVIGSVLLIFAILAMFVFYWISDFLSIVVGVLILYVSGVRFFHDFNKHKGTYILLTLAIEMAVIIVCAYFLIVTQAGIAPYLGLVIYLRGLVYFIVLQLKNKKAPWNKFVIYMATLSIGAYVLFSGNVYENELEWLLFGLIVAYAGLFITYGIMALTKK